MKVTPIIPIVPIRNSLHQHPRRNCKFIVRDGICRYVIDGYEFDGARLATAQEAAEYINMLVINSHPGMHDAEQDFKRIYSPTKELI